MPLKKHERHILGFLLSHMLLGIGAGFVFGLFILWQDVGGIYTLAMQSQDTVLIFILLFFGLFITFGSVGMGLAIMGLGEDQN